MRKRLTSISLLIALLLLTRLGALQAQDSENTVITPQNAGQLVQQALWGYGTIHDVDWAPDGSVLAVSGSLGVWLYDTQQWETAPRRTAYAEHGPVGGILETAFSPDSQTLATIGADGRVRLWNSITGAHAHDLAEDVSALALAYAPDGYTLAVALENGEVHLWNAVSLHTYTAVRGGLDAILSVAFSPDGLTLAGGDNEGRVWLWDLTGAGTGTTLISDSSQVWEVAFSPDGRTVLARGTNHDAIYLWDIESGQLRDQMASYSSAAFNPTSDYMALGHPREQVVLLDSAGIERELPIFQENESGRISSLAFSPDGSYLAAANQHHALKIWNIEQDHLLANLAGYMPRLETLALILDDKMVIVQDSVENTHLWDTTTGTEIGKLRTGGAVSPNTPVLVSVRAHAINLWHLPDGELIKQVKVGQNTVLRQVAFSPDGTLLVGAGDIQGDGVVPGTPEDTGFVRLWDGTSSWRKLDQFTFPGDPATVAISPNNTQIVYGNWWGDGFLADITTGHIIDQWNWSEGPFMISFSPDGTHLAASAIMACTAQIWDVTQGTMQVAVENGRDLRQTCGPLTWSPDGLLIAAPVGTGAIALWDAMTGDRLFVSETEMGAQHLAFSADGTQLFSGGHDGTIRVWGVP